MGWFDDLVERIPKHEVEFAVLWNGDGIPICASCGWVGFSSDRMDELHSYAKIHIRQMEFKEIRGLV